MADAPDEAWLWRLYARALATLRRARLGGLDVLLPIGNVRAGRDVKTACIRVVDGEGFITLNPDFVAERARTPARLAGVVLHEILHLLFDGLRPPGDPLIRNIAEDAVINALIFKVRPLLARTFRDLHAEDAFPWCLLRPGCDPARLPDDETRDLYAALYEPGSPIGASCDEVQKALARRQGSAAGGSPCGHPMDEDSEDGNELGGRKKRGLDPGRARFRRRVLAWLRETLGGSWGRGGLPEEENIPVEAASPSQLLAKILERFSREKEAGRLARFVPGALPDRLLWPTASVRRRDLVLLAGGVCPPFYNLRRGRVTPAAAHVYLDVSGSMADLIPVMYGFIFALRRMVDTRVFLFSTEVEEITLQQLAAGKVRSTGGTSFACVCEHILAARVDRAVIFTDGYAEHDEQLAAQVKARSEVGAVVYGRQPNHSADALRQFCREVVVLPHVVK